MGRHADAPIIDADVDQRAFGLQVVEERVTFPLVRYTDTESRRPTFPLDRNLTRRIGNGV